MEQSWEMKRRWSDPEAFTCDLGSGVISSHIHIHVSLQLLGSTCFHWFIYFHFYDSLLRQVGISIIWDPKSPPLDIAIHESRPSCVYQWPDETQCKCWFWKPCSWHWRDLRSDGLPITRCTSLSGEHWATAWMCWDVQNLRRSAHISQVSALAVQELLWQLGQICFQITAILERRSVAK